MALTELQKAISTIFEFIEKTQAGDWQELQDLLEELEREEGELNIKHSFY